MIRLCAVSTFIFANAAFGQMAERGIAIGESCERIIEHELSLGSHIISEDYNSGFSGNAGFIGFDSIYRGQAATLIYSCGDDAYDWKQLIIFGNFEKSESVQEYKSLVRELNETLGEPVLNPYSDTYWKRSMLSITKYFMEDSMQSLKLYTTSWYANEISYLVSAIPDNSSESNFWRLSYSIEKNLREFSILDTFEVLPEDAH